MSQHGHCGDVNGPGPQIDLAFATTHELVAEMVKRNKAFIYAAVDHGDQIHGHHSGDRFLQRALMDVVRVEFHRSLVADMDVNLKPIE